MFKSFLITATAFIILDLIWLGLIIKNFNLRQLAEIGRIVDGDFKILYVPAAITYLLMSAAIVIFVLPVAQAGSDLRSFFLGAVMGLIVYGVFDMTNLAILKNYPLAFAGVDMAWGSFVFGAASLVAKKFS